MSTSTSQTEPVNLPPQQEPVTDDIDRVALRNWLMGQHFGWYNNECDG